MFQKSLLLDLVNFFNRCTDICTRSTSIQENEKKASNYYDLTDKKPDYKKPSAIPEDKKLSAILENKKPAAITPTTQPRYVQLGLLPFNLLNILNILSNYYYNFQ